MAATATDVFAYSLATFLGNVGVAVTGFGMAIVYLLVWQIARLCGWESDFKHAVFVQALGLFAAQPFLVYQSRIPQHGSRALMKLLIPVTILSTPLGQVVGLYVDSETVQSVGGVIVSAFAAFEVYRNRKLISEALGCAGSAAKRARSACAGLASKPEGFCRQPSDSFCRQPSDSFCRQPSNLSARPSDSFCRQPSMSARRALCFLDSKYPFRPVYFMIGSQRSGSNWLRTMVNEREDIAGPHPPHIFDSFMPILDRFGDLHQVENRKVLVDHVLTFVERNQVPWTDRKGRIMTFDREATSKVVEDHVSRDGDLAGVDVLMVIFDYVYNRHAAANFKKTWMCKSMGMSKYHDLLLEFYGEARLRYIYLIRDPRDVTMSFMNAPVGDCHCHTIVTKWCQLQEVALKILQEDPHLVHVLRYEDILTSKAETMSSLFTFLGEETFGRVLSTSSAISIRDLGTKCEEAAQGDEATKAGVLSKQFQNLSRGADFAKTQNQKWLTGKTPMAHDSIVLVENVAHTTMRALGYEPAIVTKTQEPAVYSETDLAAFAKLNADLVEKMNEDLLEEDPGDAHRREHQAAVLRFPKIPIPDDMKRKEDHPAGQIEESSMNEVVFAAQDRDRFVLRCAAVSQAGFHPIKKLPNQDTFVVKERIAGGAQHWLAVFDGHGPHGKGCAHFTRDRLPDQIAKGISESTLVSVDYPEAVEANETKEAHILRALEEAHLAVSDMLCEAPDIACEKSGTTAISMYMDGLDCYVCNVGDSCCIRGFVQEGSDEVLLASKLSEDQTAYREEERARIKTCGGMIATAGQIDGSEPSNQEWVVGEGGQPRVWAPGQKHPGCAFTRSIGDSVATQLGVVATPEITKHTISKSDRVFILCSDGISQYMTAEECCNLALQHADPTSACAALVEEARKRWLDNEDRVDDITALVCFVDLAGNARDKIATWGGVSSFTLPPEITWRMAVWAISMGFLSGFLGGLCGIRGPPIILFFLHMSFPKAIQKANGAAITLTNISMRVIGYIIDGARGNSLFVPEDWPIYASVVLISPAGVAIGGQIFERMSDSQAKLKTLLALLLVLCGLSLLLTACYKF